MFWTSALIHLFSSSILVAAVNPRFVVPSSQGTELDYSENVQAVVAHNFSVKWRVNDALELSNYHDIVLFLQDLEQNRATFGRLIFSTLTGLDQPCVERWNGYTKAARLTQCSLHLRKLRIARYTSTLRPRLFEYILPWLTVRS